MSASMKTGTSPFCSSGFTVVGNPAAQVITSSPGRMARSRRRGEHSAETASKLAEEPELQVSTKRRPMNAASFASNAVL